LLAQHQKVRQLHWRTGTALQLLLYCPLVLPPNLRTASRREFARIEIQLQLDFPRHKAITKQLPAHQFADQSPEAVELHFPLEILVFRHIPMIGGMRGRL